MRKLQVIMLLMALFITEACALYREPTFGETLGELLFALGCMTLFGAPWLVVGLALCLTIWLIKITVKSINNAIISSHESHELKKYYKEQGCDPKDKSVWDRLEE